MQWKIITYTYRNQTRIDINFSKSIIINIEYNLIKNLSGNERANSSIILKASQDVASDRARND